MMLSQVLEPQTACMATEHFCAIQPPDQFGRRVEIAHVKIAIDDHHGIVRPLKRRKQEIRGFYRRVIAHHPALMPAWKPSRPDPGGAASFCRTAYVPTVLKWLFDPVPPGGKILSLRIRYRLLECE